MRAKKQAVVERFSPKLKVGLTTQEVLLRKKQKLTNKTKEKTTKTYTKIIFQNLFTFFNMLWALIFLALLLVGSYNNLFFAVVIILNTAIAIYQECRAKYTVEKLKLVTTPRVSVRRNGEVIQIKTEELVLDDIVYLESGNQSSADMVILNGEAEVNESLLTGESIPIKKQKGDIVLAGSFLTSGKCTLQVQKVGKDIYIQSIAKAAKNFQKPRSNLFKDLNKLIKIIGLFILPLGIFIFINNYYGQNVGLTIAVIKTCGSLVGMIPAGMFLLITIALAVGVIKLSKKKMLVQDLYSIEMLARTDVLCLDKTGTITDGSMEVLKVVPLKKSLSFDVDNIVANINNNQPTQNQTSKALSKFFNVKENLKIIKNLPFSSERKQTITVIEGLGTFALGAPEYISAKLTTALKTKIKNFSRQGLRVMMIAYLKDTDILKLEDATFTPSALILIEDHIRDDAKATIEWFKQNDVKIKIISGDNPETVSNIAMRVGVENSGLCISLEKMSLEDVAEIADKYTIFGRVTPEQKHVLIKALKSKGMTVAMTGDGVNDTLALKEADCSIAMADGSDVARNISSLVLMNSKFSSLPSVVEEGRQVINNVQKSSSLFLMKTLFTIILSIVSILSFSLYPFDPSQVFLLEMFVIGLPSLFLTLETNREMVKGNFLPVVLRKSIPYALIIFMNIAVVIILYRFNLLSYNEYTSLSTLTLTAIGYLCLVKQCLPLTKIRVICLLISIALISLFASIIPAFFNITVFSKMVFLPLGLLVSTTTLILIFWGIIERVQLNKNNNITN